MRKNSLLLILLALVILVAIVALNGERIYGWLLQLHGARPTH